MSNIDSINCPNSENLQKCVDCKMCSDCIECSNCYKCRLCTKSVDSALCKKMFKNYIL